jgi:hypothetical protein
MIAEHRPKVDHLQIAGEALLQEGETVEGLLPLQELSGTHLALGPRALAGSALHTAVRVREDAAEELVAVLVGRDGDRDGGLGGTEDHPSGQENARQDQ